MRTKMNLLVGVIGLVVVTIAPAPSGAVPLFTSTCPGGTCDLSELFAGATITLDEGGGVSKVFDNFVLGASTGTDPLDPANITVVLAPVSEVGLLFNISSGGLLTTLQTADLAFVFDLHCVGCQISDNTLTISGGQSGDGSVALSEQVLDINNGLADIADKFVFFTSASSNSSDHKIFLNPSTDIHIVKDLNIIGGPVGPGNAFVSDFSQTFSQVPEPATLLLLGIGLLGFSVTRRKRAPRQGR